MQVEPKYSGRQVRRLLLVGFGGLLVLLAFSEINALSVLTRIQERNENIRQDYVHRDRILEELKSSIYLSGTFVRDLLLEPESSRAEAHRTELSGVQQRIELLIRAYQGILRGEERVPFERFRKGVESYFDSLQPALQWSADERRKLGYAFMRDSLLPRRTNIVGVADQIALLN